MVFSSNNSKTTLRSNKDNNHMARNRATMVTTPHTNTTMMASVRPREEARAVLSLAHPKNMVGVKAATTIMVTQSRTRMTRMELQDMQMTMMMICGSTKPCSARLL